MKNNELTRHRAGNSLAHHDGPVKSPVAPSKTRQFRQMLESNDLEFLMEAHNGLSAKIVEEAGFQGIWASGLSISAALGVRDSNEASWTQVLDVAEFMADAHWMTLTMITLPGEKRAQLES